MTRDMNRGFTLLEILVVLALLALVAAITTVRLYEPYRAARLEDALMRIQFVDSQARTHSGRFARGSQIVFQLDKRQMYSSDRSGEQHYFFQLPRALEVERVLTPQEDVQRGTVAIEVSTRGTTPTYAVCIRAGDASPRWLLFSGLTGRVAFPESERDVKLLFELLQTPRAHAD